MKRILSQCFQDTVEQAPGRPAFVYGTETLTYEELEVRATKLATVLVEQGVRKGDRVGIFTQRSLESVVAVYGIMKAGAAYVPLDPFAPSEAVERSIRHCGIQILVTHKLMKKRMGALLRSKQLPLECVIGLESLEDDGIGCHDWAAVEESDYQPGKLPLVLDSDLAYIMYTSGSTGNPKGIMHTHFSGSSYAKLSSAKYELSANDRVGSHSPLHFDMSTFGYFSAPYAGATTILIPEAHTKVPASLSKLVEETAITIWYSVPYALTQMLNHGSLEQRDLSRLRWILYGGEPISPRQLYALMDRLPKARVANVYGPAEVNQCTHYEVVKPNSENSDQGDDEPIPLGAIWDETDGVILGEDERPVEGPGTGELAIHSTTMMTGYWERPDLNEKVFRSISISGQSRSCYCTGDLVSRTEDGMLQFLGRKDRQIKIRGYRVELDEIENALSTHPCIEENAVIHVVKDHEDSSIEAIVRLHTNAILSGDDIADYLSDRLPWYSVPSKIDICQEFPRTGTGKIDRRALKSLAESGVSLFSVEGDRANASSSP